MCVSLLAAFRAELWGSVAGESQVHSTVYSVFPCCFKSLKRKREKKKRQTAVVHKEERSHGELVVNAAWFSSSSEKLVFRKARTTGKKSKNLAIEQVGQCSCSWVCCVLLSCVDVG